MPPAWLPEKIVLPTDDTLAIDALYRIFHRDFVRGQCRFGDRQVWYDRRTKAGEVYEEGFWHVISRGSGGPPGSRSLDPYRAEKLPWCKPTLENAPQPTIRIWDYKEKRKVKTYLWLEDLDYLIVLRKQDLRAGKVAHLVTAFHVDGDATKRGLEKKYQRRETAP